MSNTNDVFQVDYQPDEKKIKINLPEEVWRNIDTIIMTRLFEEELVVEKQKEGKGDVRWKQYPPHHIAKKEMMPNDARQNANRKDYKLKQPVK